MLQFKLLPAVLYSDEARKQRNESARHRHIALLSGLPCLQGVCPA